MDNTELKNKLRAYLLNYFGYSENILDSFFDPLNFDIYNNKITILTPHSLFYNWLKTDFKADLNKALINIIGNAYLNINYETHAHKQNLYEQNHILENKFKIKSEFNFDNYLVNAKNFFPVSILKKISEGIIEYNPVVLYGTTGTGKTHLLKALTNSLLLRKNILFFGNIEEFNLLYKQNIDLKNQLNKYAAIIIDDIHNLNSYSELCSEFHIFIDKCLENKVPLIVSINEHPANWNKLPEIIRGRLEQGLNMILHEADMEIKLNYTQIQCKNKKINLTKSQILTLAQQCSSLRRLEGALQRLTALQDIFNNNVSDIDIADIISHTADSNILSPQEIIGIVANRLEVLAKDIISPKRNTKINIARNLAMFMCRSLLGTSYPALGKIFGGRDHSTIMYSIKKIQLLSTHNNDMHNLISELSLSCRKRS